MEDGRVNRNRLKKKKKTDWGYAETSMYDVSIPGKADAITHAIALSYIMVILLPQIFATNQFAITVLSTASTLHV